MGKSSICEKTGLTKGTWTPEEDRLLTAYIKRYGHQNWRKLPKYAGLSRCGKSCRLRWMNYLRPNIKRGHYTREEEELIINLHAELGNRWSAIAARLPGRTDNEIKNHWHAHLRKCIRRTSIAKEAKQALGREYPHDNITPFILESSAVLPISPPKSSDFSSSSTYDLEVAISGNQAIKDDSEISSDRFIEYGGNFWTEPFLVEDSYKVENSTMPVFVNEYSVSPLADALYSYDLYTGYDMAMLFDF